MGATVRQIIFFFCAIHPLSGQGLQVEAKRVLDAIFETTADYRFQKPSLGFSSARRDVAYFFPDKNTLTIEETALDVCRSMGADSIHALAFIIGHELAHVYQEEMRQRDFTSSFLTYDKGIHARIRTEKQADIHGALSAYIAGYKIQGVVPKLLAGLYKAYGLTGVALVGYPSLEERQRTAREVERIVDDLICLWENAPLVTCMGEYAVAASLYAYIGSYYRGTEVLSNTGLNYLLEAFYLDGVPQEPYLLPVEFIRESRFQMPGKEYGAKDLDFEKELRRAQLLERARKAFEEALAQEKDNATALLNLASCHLLAKQPEKAYSLLRLNARPKGYWAKFLILESITSYSLDKANRDEAVRMLEEVERAGTPFERSMARHNKNWILGLPYEDASAKAGCFAAIPAEARTLNPEQPNVFQLLDRGGTSIRYGLISGGQYFEASLSSGKNIVIRRLVPLNKGQSVPSQELKRSISVGGLSLLNCPEKRMLQIISNRGALKEHVVYDVKK